MTHVIKIGYACFCLSLLCLYLAPPAAGDPAAKLLKSGQPGSGNSSGESAAKGGSFCSSSIVSDGGFESGSPSSSWDEFDIAVGSPLCDSGCGFNEAYSGSWWAWFGGVDGLDYAAWLYQTVQIPVADSATLEFALRIPSAEASTEIYVFVDGTAVAFFDEYDAGSFSEYQIVQIDVSEFADGSFHDVGFEVYYPLGGFANVFVDDVCITTSGSGGEGEGEGEGEGDLQLDGSWQGSVEDFEFRYDVLLTFRANELTFQMRLVDEFFNTADLAGFYTVSSAFDSKQYNGQNFIDLSITEMDGIPLYDVVVLPGIYAVSGATMDFCVDLFGFGVNSIPDCAAQGWSQFQRSQGNGGMPTIIGEESSDIGGSVFNPGPLLPLDGGRYLASISPASDVDVFAFDAVANATYVVETFGELDTVLRILNASGVELAFDDDGGNGLSSRLFWTAPSTGRYFAEVASWGNFSSGSYQVSVTQIAGGPPPPPTGGNLSYYVNPVSGNDSLFTSGTANDPFRTINGALQAVSSVPGYQSAMIFLAAGVYQETVKLLRDVTLMGASQSDPSRTVIRPSTDQLREVVDEVYVIGANNASLRDLTIEQPELSAGEQPAGRLHLQIPTVSMTVINVNFVGTNRTNTLAIEIFGNASTDVMIDQCRFRRFFRAIDALDSDAIITNCVFEDIRSDAVFIDAPKSQKQGLPGAVPNMGSANMNGTGGNLFRCDSIDGRTIVNSASSTMSAQLNDFCGLTNEDEILSTLRGNVTVCPVLINGEIVACADGSGGVKTGSGCGPGNTTARTAAPDMVMALLLTAVFFWAGRRRPGHNLPE